MTDGGHVVVAGDVAVLWRIVVAGNVPGWSCALCPPRAALCRKENDGRR